MASDRADLSRDDFRDILLSDTPLLDVRAPVEFNAGAFPSAVNLPILDDQQRQEIGLEYKQQGQAKAIELGLQLATPEIRAQRINMWSDFVAQYPKGYLYCFRGGLRSRTTQAWLAEAGYDDPLVQGGYKAMRGFLLEQLERLCEKGNIILLAGATGVGKTELINAYSSAIDLECRAKHRGSAFGKTFADQPAQIDWENQIIIDWLRCEANSDLPVLIEAESHLIGRIHLPKVLQEAMARAPILTLQAGMAERTERLYHDYVVHSLVHYRSQAEASKENAGLEYEPWNALQNHILDCLQRIRKRLGGLRYQQLCKALPNAIEQLREQHDESEFHSIIRVLLDDYYDRLYRHHMQKNTPRAVYTGNMTQVNAWLANQALQKNHLVDSKTESSILGSRQI